MYNGRAVAGVAELADAHVWGACGFTIRVRPPSPAPTKRDQRMLVSFCCFGRRVLSQNPSARLFFATHTCTSYVSLSFKNTPKTRNRVRDIANRECKAKLCASPFNLNSVKTAMAIPRPSATTGRVDLAPRGTEELSRKATSNVHHVGLFCCFGRRVLSQNPSAST